MSEGSIPSVRSVYEDRRMTALDHLKISAYWFGSNFIWGALLGPVMSKQMETLAPQDSAGKLGLLYTVGALPALVVPLVAGPLSDRCRHPSGRRRPYILVGGLIALVGLLAMFGASHMTSLILYLAGYLLLQLGSNTALAAYSGVIPDLVPYEHRGTASGYMAMMSQVGTLLGALSTGKLIGSDNVSAVYITLMAVFGLFLVFSVLGLDERPLVGEVQGIDWHHYFRSLFDPFRSRDFTWVWITRALMMFGFYAIQPFILYYLRDVTKVPKPADTAAVLFGLILLGATVSGVLGGWVSDRTGRKPVVYAASFTISLMCVAFIFCQNLTQVGIAGMIFGLGYGAYISVDWALGADVLPSKLDAGKDMGVWHVSMTLPQQIAPFVASQILELFAKKGTDPVQYGWSGYVFVFIIAAVCFLLSAVLIKQVRGAK